MGMLVDGTWTESSADIRLQSGEFVRQDSQFRIDLSKLELNPDPGRYHIFSSWSCPWSQRVMIVRNLRGLQDIVTMSAAWGRRIQGYSITDGSSVQLPGAERYINYLHQVYSASSPAYTGRVTVPVLWDAATQRILSNESDDIAYFLDRLFPGDLGAIRLAPTQHLSSITSINKRVYDGLANAVYEAGYTSNQKTYMEKVSVVFETIDWLDKELQVKTYLVGNQLTLSDVYLIPTILRFSAIYAALFKCNLHPLNRYRHICGYVKSMMADDRIRSTFDLELAKAGYYLDPRLNPVSTIPVGPAHKEWD